MTSPLSRRIADRLRPIVGGDLFTDPDTLDRYSRTQGWYRIVPLCVLVPRSVHDVREAVRTATDLGVAVIPRGGGTGLPGQGIGYGLVIDFRPSMGRVLDVGPDSVRVEPGAVLDDVNAALAPSGRWIPIDPTSSPHCTVGGMVSTNAAGWHGPAYGATKDHLLEATLVLADGSTLVARDPSSSAPPGDPSAEYTRQLEAALRPSENSIIRAFPRVAKNSSGYDLPGALRSRPLDLRRLIAGSEGTLGCVVESVIRTLPLPASTASALVLCPSYREAVKLLTRLRRGTYAAAEFMDASFLSHAAFPETWTPPSGGPLLFLDVHAGSDDEAAAAVGEITRTAASVGGLRWFTMGADDRTQIFALRQQASERINMDRERWKASFIEDAAVPLEALSEYVAFVSELLTRKGIAHALYGHAADGNIHCSPFVDVRNLDHYRMIDEIASTVAAKVRSLGGTLSGEHGDGFARTPFLERMYGSDVYALFARVKKIFDPAGTFNPGIIVAPQEGSILHDLALE